MKTFHLTADVTFEADNIDDALVRLATHFLWLKSKAEDRETFTLRMIGQAEVAVKKV